MTKAGPDSTTLTLHIPVEFKRRGGRKLVLAPDGLALPVPPKPTVDEIMVKMLVKAHRWRRRIESGQAKSITDLAEQEHVTIAYVNRVLQLTCLAPDIVAAMLDGRQPRGLSMNIVLKGIPEAWEEQRRLWGFLEALRPDHHGSGSSWRSAGM